jgi:protein-S-isoprenylcysteine O-methyltransferase Ste14
MQRLLPPVLFCLLIVVMLLSNSYCPVFQLVPSPYHWPGILLLMGGLAIAHWHARLFRQLQTNINTFRAPDKLVQEGLFRYTRNPMYLGFLVSLSGVAWLLGNASAWIWVLVFFAMADRWYIPAEEKLLLQQFGEDYRLYRQRTKRWI